MLISMGLGGQGLDIRELVLQKSDMPAAHESDVRPTRHQLIQNYAINEDVSSPPPKSIGVFDDVLTAGKHFKAMQHVLSERFPGVPVLGFFVARRLLGTDDILF